MVRRYPLRPSTRIAMNEPTVPAIVDFAVDRPDTSGSKPAADQLVSGTPEHVAHNYFSDRTGRFHSGIWESTTGKWRVRYAENEFCHITRGHVRIEDPTGRRWEFRQGDSFVIPSGFAGTWEVLEPVSKFYVIYEPPVS
jgi:uncharacterized cupin superfamily protein